MKRNWLTFLVVLAALAAFCFACTLMDWASLTLDVQGINVSLQAGKEVKGTK